MIFLLLSVLSAAPAGEVSIAIPGLRCAAEVPDARCEFYGEFFSEQLSRRGEVRVTTAQQMTTLLGMERQKALLGCGETSCLAELAGALGSEVVIIGSLARVGEEYAGTFKALDTRDGSIAASRSVRVPKEEGLLDFLSSYSVELHAELMQKFRGKQVAVATSSGSRFGPGVIVSGAIGLAGFVTSGVLFGVAKGTEARLRDGDPTLTSPTLVHQLAQEGAGQQVASIVALGVGVVGLGAAVLFFFLTPDAQHVAWVPDVSSGALVWRFP